MIIVERLDALKSLVKNIKKEGKSVGFVPTMGYLHSGHGALIQKARSENDCVIVSVYVNPTQFGPNEDFEAYPRSTGADQALMEELGVDVAFFPSSDELYPNGYVTYVEVTGEISKQLCGASRPGHFKGVTTIVHKLFSLVEPQRAYFGQKDAQQVAIIRRMVLDLNSPVQIVTCPIVREPDGLALSSRNVYLNPTQRIQALGLSKALFKAAATITAGEESYKKIVNALQAEIGSIEGGSVDYIAVVDGKSLMPITQLKGEMLIAVAVFFGKTRLIDNVIVEA